MPWPLSRWWPRRASCSDRSRIPALGQADTAPLHLAGFGLVLQPGSAVDPADFPPVYRFRLRGRRAITAGIAAICAVVACYGLAVSLATTPYLALVIDLTSEEERPRAVGLIWCLLTVGIVVGAIATSICLKGLDGVSDPALLEPVLFQFLARVAVVVFALTVFATWGVEPHASERAISRSEDREDAITLGMPGA